VPETPAHPGEPRPGRPAGRAAVVVLAAGSGSRVGTDLNKAFLPLAGRRIVTWSLAAAGAVAEVGHLVLVVRPEDAELAAGTVAAEVGAAGPAVQLVPGGPTRHESEVAALTALQPRIAAGDVDVIAVHDAARPLAGAPLFRCVITTAARVGGAVPGLPAAGLVPVGDVGPPAAPSPARCLTAVQTPQAFRAAELLAAYSRAGTEAYQGTDTSSSVEAFSDLMVRVVPGSRHNIKITYLRDVRVAERLLAARDRTPAEP